MADTYHIGLNKGDVPKIMLLPGDPARAEYISKFFDNPRKLAQNREFTTYVGTYKGVPIGVTSTGIGGPSAAIAVEELIQVGADIFIRVGTAGSLQPHVKLNDLVVVSGAVREDGTSRQYVPISFPAVADIDVMDALRLSAREKGYRYHIGLAHVKDAFYIEEPADIPIGVDLVKKWDFWKKAGVLATSMESAAIFVVAQIRGCKAGTVLVAVGETAEGEPFSEIDTTSGTNNAITCALEAAVRLHEAGDEGVLN